MELLDPSPHLIPNFQESPSIPLIVGQGDEQRTFNVHEVLLTTSSEYFRTALQSDFIEGQQKTCRFSQDDPHAFHVFVQYLYTGAPNLAVAWPRDEGGEPQSWYCLWAQTFALGNKLVAPGFKKCIVFNLASVLSKTEAGLAMQTLLTMAKIVYDGTLQDDGYEMRDLLARYCTTRLGMDKKHFRNGSSRCWELQDLKALAGSQQEEFLTEVLCKAIQAPTIDAASFMRLHYRKP